MESVTKVHARSDFKMELQFNTGETLICDVYLHILAKGYL